MRSGSRGLVGRVRRQVPARRQSGTAEQWVFASLETVAVLPVLWAMPEEDWTPAENARHAGYVAPAVLPTTPAPEGWMPPTAAELDVQDLGLGPADAVMIDRVAAKVSQQVADPVPVDRSGYRSKDKRNLELNQRIVIKTMAEKILGHPLYQSNLEKRALQGTLPPAIEVLLWQYVGGRPTEAKEEVPIVPVTITHELTTRRDEEDDR